MPQATPATSTETAARAAASSSALVQALAALCLGIVVIGMAGFSHIEAVHNASHDTRHSNAFPCH